jgi:DNA replication regulator DPB11
MATNFSRRTTHLLCPSGQGAKFDKAGEWQIPVVGNAWLAEMIQLGAIPTTNGFLIGAGGVQIPPERLPELSLSVDVNALLRPDKGKLKQTESLGGMSDITNGLSAMC